MYGNKLFNLHIEKELFFKMLIFKEIKELQDYLTNQKGKTIGFVPTMGALHEGHVSLIRASKQQSDITVCSIFVNPTQFNKKDDLDNYPRNNEVDIKKLELANCDLVFLPSVKEMYPAKVVKSFNFGALEKVMEGEHRPGHFNGVALVIERFLEIINPDFAFFGEKDYQQLAVVKTLAQQLNFKTKIIGCKIIREKNGLAMSSRNERLSKNEKNIASVIHQTLLFVKENYDTQPIDLLKQKAIDSINNNKELAVEYFEIANKKTLQADNITKENAVAFVAVNVGDVRLIDNMTIID